MEAIDINALNLFPHVPEKIPGEYWDMATGAMNFTLSTLGNLDPNRTYRFFDNSPFVTSRLESILDRFGKDNVQIEEMNISDPSGFVAMERPLAAIRVKNAVTYAPGFSAALPLITEYIVPGGRLIFQFDSNGEVGVASRSHGEFLQSLLDRGWELTVDGNYPPYTTYTYIKPD